MMSLRMTVQLVPGMGPPRLLTVHEIPGMGLEENIMLTIRLVGWLATGQEMFGMIGVAK